MPNFSRALLIPALLFAVAGCADEPAGAPPASTGVPVLQESTLPAAEASPLPTVSDAEFEAAIEAIPRLSSFILFQGDRIVREQYANGAGRDRPINIKSASKSVLNALTGIALAQGHLENLDDPVARYLPRYFDHMAPQDARRSITVRHLLTMSSGLPSTSIRNYGAWVTSPDWVGYVLKSPLENTSGSYMTYSTGDSHVLAAVLTEATGMPLRQFAERMLFTPAGMRVGGWDRDPQGIYFGGNNLALSPGSLLNFGRLYLGKGEIDGRRILAPEWVEQSWQRHFPNSSFNMRHDYGYLWWHTTFARQPTWFAWGYGGQFLFVLPGLDAVVVMTCDPDTRTRGTNNLIYDLMENVIVPWATQGRDSMREAGAPRQVAAIPAT